MTTIDLNERRKGKQPKTVKAGAHTYTLATFLPASLLGAMAELRNPENDNARSAAAAHEIFASLFGEALADQAARDMSIDEAIELFTEVQQTTQGESEASSSSSRSTGTRPRRTSRGSTT